MATTPLIRGPAPGAARAPAFTIPLTFSAKSLGVPAAAPSGFGFGVAVHPTDPQTAWFAPAVKDECRVPADAKLVIGRTRDGGKTFDVLQAGLPTEPAYDIVYRHALSVDESGDRLAFGSTTGGLWVTENQGELWKPVSARLPPVHAVRFAG